MRFIFAFVCLFPYLVFWGSSLANARWHEWKSQHYRDHPLVGMVYLPARQGPIDSTDRGQALRRLMVSRWAARVRFLLIGENHDNPDHHILQAKLIDDITEFGRSPNVVFEMIPRSLAGEASIYDLKKDPQLEDFAKRLKWEERGWNSWDIYKPVALAAAIDGLRILPGDLDRATIRRLYSTETALSADERKRFGLDETLSPAHQASLNKELNDSHCGLIGEEALPAMSRIQRARDGSMADALISGSLRSGAVLIAGNGHVRKDRGVPLVLRKRLPGYNESKVSRPDAQGRSKDYVVRTAKANTFSIGLIEVRDGIVDPKQYGLINEEGDSLYDVVIFTPKANISDPCDAMRKQFKSKKKSSND